MRVQHGVQNGTSLTIGELQYLARMAPGMTRADQILLIDDDPRHAEALEGALREAGAEAPRLEWVRTLSRGLDLVSREEVSAVFLSLALPDGQGATAIEGILSSAPLAPLILVGGVNDEDVCKAGMSHGAQDYLLEGHLDTYAFARALRNITDRETARYDLFVEQQRAQVTLNSIGDGVLSVDMSDVVTYLNPVAEHMTGWGRQEAVGRPLTEVFQIIDSVTRNALHNPLALAIQLDRAVGLSANCVLVRRDGCETPIEDTAAPIHDRLGRTTGAVIVFHDVSVARAMVLEMSHLAQHDALTDLPNRMLLKERLTQAILLAKRNRHCLALLYLDVDGFKRVNDSLGHAVGDSLLKSVAARLSACVRESDTVSRQGGDEFVVLLPEIAHASDAVTAAARMLTEIKKPHSIDDRQLCVTASIGVSTYPEHGEDTETLLKTADAAMYHAKEHGRDNYHCFDGEMSLQACRFGGRP
jgi:diguanylate cyclase (GGDEF)-like protein/PAS domain S-box-containing protein